jgi:hypothetical protein
LELEPALKHTLTIMAWKDTVEFGCYASVQTICKYTGRARSQVYDHFHRLKRLGLIQLHPKQRKGRAKVYQLGYQLGAVKPNVDRADNGRTARRARVVIPIEPELRNSAARGAVDNSRPSRLTYHTDASGMVRLTVPEGLPF